MPGERERSGRSGDETPQADFSTVGKRLRWAIEQRPPRGRERGVRMFQRDIEQRAAELQEQKGERLPGVTLPSIMTYLNDETDPSLAFLREAARILEVPAAWLAYGEPITAAEEPSPIYGWEVREAGRDEGLIRNLVPGIRAADGIRRRALRRFAQKLADAETPESPWTDELDRYRLLRAALEFMRGVEESLNMASRRFQPDEETATQEEAELERLGAMDELLLTDSSSKGWQVAWMDAVLELFARRVYGLGERAGGLYDAHEAPNPLQLDRDGGVGGGHHHPHEEEEDHDAKA